MTFCTDIHGPQRMNPNDFNDPLSSSTASTDPLTCPLVDLQEVHSNHMKWIAMEFCTDIHVSLRMNCSL